MHHVHRTLSHLSAFVLLAAALLFVGCDSSDDPDDPNNPGNPGNAQATVSVTGDISASFSGNAFAVYDSDGDFLGIVIFDGTFNQYNPIGSESLTIAWDDDNGDVSEQSYPIADGSDDDTFAGAYLDYTDSANFRVVSSQSGSIRFTEVSDNEVQGTFSYSGQAIIGLQTTGSASVEGSFTATVLRDQDIPDAP